MANLITMDSKKFIKEFCKEYNPHDFQIILVSKDITSKGKYDNVYVAKDLFPTKQVLASRINAGTEEFKFNYVKQLNTKEAQLVLLTIVKSIMKKNMNILLLCSETEDDYEFLEVISDYMETKFKLPSYTMKSLKKKGDKILTKAPKNIDEIEKAYVKQLGMLEKSTPNDKEKDKNKEEKKLKKELSKLIDNSKKKKLYKMLLEFSDFDDDIDDYSKEELQEVCLAFVDSLNAKKLNKLKKFLK